MMVFPSQRGETPGESDVTVSGHKQHNWKVHTGPARVVQCYPLITTMSSLTYHLTSTWPGPLTPAPTRSDDTSHAVGCNLSGKETTHLGLQRQSWMRLTWFCSYVQTMTFLSTVRAKAKHPSAICPSRVEHNSGIETSASSDNHTDRRQCQGKSHTRTTV